MNTLFLYKKD